ncbi:MAG: hypothetical protein KatS3mg045_1960 [Bellilinea sp.]|jgi:hypothetical protein|nr:MAG: hypothetical protein KatS3mg045_1960 [Bellilinea sp.]
MDPTGPFAQLAEHQRRNDPPRTILARRAVGQISVAGTTATVVNQETRSNQDAGAVTPDQAIVCLIDILRWDAADRWLIVASEQAGLWGWAR